MVMTRMSFGFICSDEDIKAVQRRPEAHEQAVIDRYRDAYKKAMQHPPHGLHYIPFPGSEESVPVWIPIED
jgi:hypothetical protein